MTFRCTSIVLVNLVTEILGSRPINGGHECSVELRTCAQDMCQYLGYKDSKELLRKDELLWCIARMAEDSTAIPHMLRRLDDLLKAQKLQRDRLRPAIINMLAELAVLEQLSDCNRQRNLNRDDRDVPQTLPADKIVMSERMHAMSRGSEDGRLLFGGTLDERARNIKVAHPVGKRDLEWLKRADESQRKLSEMNGIAAGGFLHFLWTGGCEDLGPIHSMLILDPNPGVFPITVEERARIALSASPVKTPTFVTKQDFVPLP